MFQKINNILVGLILSASFAFSQNLENELTAISNRIEAAKTVAIESDVTVFSKMGGSKVYSAKASMYVDGLSKKSVLGEIEYIETDAYFVQLDREERAILILKRKDVEAKIPKDKFELDVKKMQQMIRSKDNSANIKTTLVSSSGGVNRYSITGVKGYEQISIELNTSKNSIVFISYQFDNSEYSGQYVEVRYSRFEFDKDVKSHFDLTNYFTVSGNTYKLHTTYSGYKLFTEL